MEKPVGPAEFDLYKPSASRVYDYLLGGSHNFEVDRDVARQMLRLAPEAAQAAAANRHFMARAVRYLVDQGITQFLDIGSGIPTVGNVHEIAQRYAPDSRVVYVDIDPVAVMHSRHILDGDRRCAVIQGDLRDPRAILDDSLARDLLDFDRPVAVLLVAVLHFIHDHEDPAGIVRELRDSLSPGSHLVLSHASWPADATVAVRQAQHTYDRMAAQLVLRTRDEVATLFDGFDLLEPGLVTVANWRPDTEAEMYRNRTDRLPALAAVGSWRGADTIAGAEGTARMTSPR
ncbi:MAG TPA: SAM-dependent methyltransferase [Rugosimonospora sp.]|nr:SAM-dependent methyltransferase [Rugosimonospora sp.]